MTTRGTLILIGLALVGVQAKIPDYIHVCKRNDPNIDSCIKNSIEELRPKLIEGIPDLDVPSIDPLQLDEVVVSKSVGFRAIGTDVTVRGASNFDLRSLVSNIAENQFAFDIIFPNLRFDANYDLNAKLLSVTVKGKGPIQFNTTDVQGKGIFKGQKETVDGKTILKLTSLGLKLKIKNYSVRLDNLFDGDKALGDGINAFLNEQKIQLIELLVPMAEKTVSEVLLSVANNMLKKFEYDELFPAS